MMERTKISDEAYESHRSINSQVTALYLEIAKLAGKKPTERITPLIAKKINHVIRRVQDQVAGDEFLDAIETVPAEGTNMIRFDEASIILAELREALHRQSVTPEYVEYKQAQDNEALTRFGLNMS